MRRNAVPSRTASTLPRFIIPCPFCAGQMLVAAVEPTLLDGVEDVTHRCTECGCALTQMIGPRESPPIAPRDLPQ